MYYKKLWKPFKLLFKYLKPPRGFRLTTAGKIFFVFLVAIIIAAMITGNNLLFMVLSAMLAFMIVSGIESERNIRHLKIERLIPSEIFARRTTKIGYIIRNDHNSSSRLILSDIASVNVPFIKKDIPETCHVSTCFNDRGKFKFKDITILTTFPYGLFEKSITLPAKTNITIYPCPQPCFDLINSGHSEGGHDTNKVIDAISHIRAYIPGDSLPSIVWKKQNTGLTTRVAEGGAGRTGIVIVIPGPHIEEKISKATFIILELSSRNLLFGLSINEYFSGLDSSFEHKRKILSHLAYVEDIHPPKWSTFDARFQLIYI